MTLYPTDPIAVNTRVRQKFQMRRIIQFFGFYLKNAIEDMFQYQHIRHNYEKFKCY